MLAAESARSMSGLAPRTLGCADRAYNMVATGEGIDGNLVRLRQIRFAGPFGLCTLRWTHRSDRGALRKT